MPSSISLIKAKELVTVDPLYTAPDNPLGIIQNGMMAFDTNKILWIGPESNFPKDLYPQAHWLIDPTETENKVILPGLIDSHTHPIFAGNRAKEFEMRLQGVTYQDIAQAGGGIQTTVQATRNASEAELKALAKERFERMLTFGVTTVEAKSGYGLDQASELKSLKVLNDLQQEIPLTIVPTYMGAHDIPPEYKGKTDDYVELLCAKLIPEVAKTGLAKFCDVFCEEGYFDVAQSRRILECAKSHGMGIRIHAEEFKDIGGAVMAGEIGAASADHLLNISDAGIESLKAGGTVATLLPGTAFYLRVPYAPARKLLDAGATVAVATDFNPGSCMTENLQLMMTLACIQMRMTPAETIQAVTFNAAKALKLEGDRGSLALGKRADWVLFDTDSYQELLYHFGVNFVNTVVINGKIAHTINSDNLIRHLR